MRIVLLVLAFSLLNCATTKQSYNDCHRVRAAFDIGSGTTKVKVAQVNVCTQKIITILAANERPVPYKKDLAENSGQRFSSKVTKQGQKVLIEMIQDAKAKGASQYSAVATSAFRKAENQKDVIKKLQQAVKDDSGVDLPIFVISQQDEAEMGFYGAAAISKKPLDKIIVWDIGSGSMQISTYIPKNKNILAYKGQLASVPMRDYIAKDLKSKMSSSPNPIGPSDFKNAVRYAKKAATKVDSAITKKVATSTVLGIGGVHYYSLREQTKTNKSFTPQQVRVAAQKNWHKSDQEIGGDYADTQVSNLALVLGFMEELQIPKVHPLKVNMADGLLVNPKYWK